MSDLTISIHGRNKNNTINDKEYPKFDDASICLKSEGGSLASKNVRIVIEPSAVKPLFESIAWGTKYRRGIVEQSGILIGNYYRDGSSRDAIIWADVVMVIPADPALVNASFETIDITSDAWKKMYEDAEEYRSENIQIIGWYHTHLGHINTRFSGLDRSTQRKAFTYEYSFGVIFNPNQEKWSAFYGSESRECVGVLLFDEELVARYGKPQITIRQVNGDSELQEDGSVVHFDGEGNPIPNREVNVNSLSINGDDALSVRQLVRQFFDGIGKLVTKPKERDVYCREELPVRPQMPHQNYEKRKVIQNVQQSCSEPERPGGVDTPKIEIRSAGQIAPTVKCVFYSVSNIKCVIEKDTVDEIIRYKQCCPSRSLWGCIRKSGSGWEISIVASDREANARIVFSRNNEINRLEVMELKKSSKANIKFMVFVDNANAQTIDIRIMIIAGRT